MNCTRCPSPARWRDADGRHWCAGHVPTNGKALTRIPAAEIDIVDRLNETFTNEELCREAAAEIRRLRALVEAAGDKSGSC
jgi:hypothetical protein